MKPVVAIISGWSGTGKSHLLERMRDANPGIFQILTPARMGDEFDPKTIDWDSHAVIALDDVLLWEPASVVTTIPALERYAQDCDKQLILVTQRADDLAVAGIRFSTEPLWIHLTRRLQSVEISYDGTQLNLPGIGFELQGSGAVPENLSQDRIAALK